MPTIAQRNEQWYHIYAVYCEGVKWFTEEENVGLSLYSPNAHRHQYCDLQKGQKTSASI